ncbi:hypothetical protein VPHD432_0198 [Vibrio phage D432]
MMLRPSEMFVNVLQQLQASFLGDIAGCSVYYQNQEVAQIEQLEYDKFIVRFTGCKNDEEIRCDGIFISEFLDIVKSFEVQ